MNLSERWFAVDIAKPDAKLEKEIEVCEACLAEVVADWVKDNAAYMAAEGYTEDDYRSDCVHEKGVEVEGLDPDSAERNAIMADWYAAEKDQNSYYARTRI
jgi:hypothetical protein